MFTTWLDPMLRSLGVIVGGSFVAHLLIPARVVKGYVVDDRGEALTYRLNGLPSLLLFIVCTAVALVCGVVNVGFIVEHYVIHVVSLCGFGLVLSCVAFALWGHVEDGLIRCATTAQGAIARPRDTPAPSAAARFFFGTRWNPRWNVFGVPVDGKVFLYQLGANGCAVALVDALAWATWTQVNPPMLAMVVYVTLMAVFLLDYASNELAHLWTYDFFAERCTGFKLMWGCIAFYPTFYVVPVFPLLWSSCGPRCPSYGPGSAVVTVGLYACGWLLTRGSNMQKFAWKRRPVDGSTWALLGCIPVPQRAVPGSNGRLLCSGFWGFARHVNYLGEILQALALALPGLLASGGGPMGYVALLYPAYYVALFVGRERDDDSLCRAKYGRCWQTYCDLVPYRICPYLY